MNSGFKYKLWMFVYYIVIALILESAMFLSLDIGLVARYWLYDFSIILMIGGLIFIIPSYIAQGIVTGLILGVQTLLFYLNYTLYSLYGDVFSVDMITLFKEAAKAVTSDFSYIWLIVGLVLAYIAIVVGLVFIVRKQRKHPMAFKSNFTLVMVMMLLIIQGLSSSLFVVERNGIKATQTETLVEAGGINDDFLLRTSMLKIASLKAFGVYGYYVNNMLNTLTKGGSNTLLNSAIDYFNSGKTFTQQDSELFGVDKDNNVIMVMMESLEWYGLSDGKYDSHTLSAELTPNIYALANEGFTASNFFAKSKTNISEGIGFIGSYPIGKYMQNVTSNSSSTQYDFTLPSILSEKGYVTNYFHSNESSYYERNRTHTKLGFDNVYCWDYDDFGYDGGFKWGHWIKEEDFVYSALDYMIPEKSNKIKYGDEAQKFFTFYTTVSSHGPYDNNNDNADQVEYKEFVKYGDSANLPVDERVQTQWYTNMLEAYGKEGEGFVNKLINYQATVVGLDRAIGVLVKQLKEYGIYDNTTIVLYSDHNAYYNLISNVVKGVPAENYMDKNLNTIPLIIKSSGISSYTKDGQNLVSTDRFCSAYDLVPTLLDVLGISFNKNLYVGNSLFAATPSVITDNSGNTKDLVLYYSLTGGIISEDIYTLDMTHFNHSNSTTVNELNAFKVRATQLLEQLNYIYTLYAYGAYDKIQH